MFSNRKFLWGKKLLFFCREDYSFLRKLSVYFKYSRLVTLVLSSQWTSLVWLRISINRQANERIYICIYVYVSINTIYWITDRRSNGVRCVCPRRVYAATWVTVLNVLLDYEKKYFILILWWLSAEYERRRENKRCLHGVLRLTD